MVSIIILLDSNPDKMICLMIDSTAASSLADMKITSQRVASSDTDAQRSPPRASGPSPREAVRL